MYQRSRAVAGRLGPRCSWAWEGSPGRRRWAPGDSTRCCYRARPRDLEISWDKLPPGLVPVGSTGPAFHSPFSRRPLEASSTLPALLSPTQGSSAVVSGSKSKSRLCPPTHLPNLETRALFRPTVLSPPEGMGDAVTLVNGRQEDDIAVSDSEGLDSSSLDSLHSLFHGWQCHSPYQAPEVNLGPLTPFRATTESSSPSRSSGSDDSSMEDHLAAMHQKLCSELPGFLLKTHDYSIYSQDVEFDNEILHLKTRTLIWHFQLHYLSMLEEAADGRVMYLLALTLCRFVAWNYFADLRLEVLKVTQHSENWSIQARWRIIGLPFHVLLLRFYKRDKAELYRTYDAYSTFFLDSQGLIKCHRVSKLMPSQPPPATVKKLLVASLLGLGLSDQRPCLQLFFTALAGKQPGLPAGCRNS